VARVEGRTALGPNRCGSAVNIVRGGTVFSSSPNVPPEDMTAAFDAKTGTKWFAGNTVATGSIGYDFGAGATHVVSYYTITSANDWPGRDPAAWQFQGSNDGTNWTTLDTRTAQTFAARFRTNSYDCAMRGSYRSYRLNVTANSGSPALQLAEIQLFGL
jgi:F5/8 type C domain